MLNFNKTTAIITATSDHFILRDHSFLLYFDMSNQKRELSEVTTVPNNTEIQDNGNNQVSNADKQIEKSNTNERSSSEYVNSNDLTVSNEQETTVRITMPQDIRYSTEKGDQEKLMEKYNSYQVSDKNSCNIRFLIDHRQKRNLLGRNEGRDLKNGEFFST